MGGLIGFSAQSKPAQMPQKPPTDALGYLNQIAQGIQALVARLAPTPYSNRTVINLANGGNTVYNVQGSQTNSLICSMVTGTSWIYWNISNPDITDPPDMIAPEGVSTFIPIAPITGKAITILNNSGSPSIGCLVEQNY